MGLFKREKKFVFYFLIKIKIKAAMFSNCIERLGHKKKQNKKTTTTRTTTNKQRKTKEKINK